MIFVRRTGNSNTYDPRQKNWAIFKCLGCGHEEFIDVTFKTSFKYEEQIPCPKCKTSSLEEYTTSLRLKIDRLTKEKSAIEVQIDQLVRELEQKEVNT